MPTINQSVKFVEINEEQHLQRIDNFLLKQLKGVPKGKIYKILRKGEVRVNKKRAKPEYKLQSGDVVRIPPIQLSEPGTTPNPSQQLQKLVNESILFEDSKIIVVNKPSGIAVHGGSGINSGVIETLRISRPNNDYLELVHRIDRDTSGCLMIAKRRSALRSMHEQLRTNRVKKVYHAVVKGHWDKGLRQCDAPLFKNQLKGGERIVKVDEVNGKDSKTKFSVINAGNGFTVIEARPITGRTHQIRVHCQHLGHPIANDSKYGDEDFDRLIKNKGCKRLCLHARALEFYHPETGQPTKIEAQYDAPLKGIIESCK